MILTREKAYGAYLVFEIEGRIDGLTSSTLDKLFEQAADDGNHKLIADFSSVSYISSAGLRVFIHAQKKLRPVGGEVILLSMQEAALDVFRVSGLQNLFRIINSLDELGDMAAVPGQDSETGSLVFSEDRTFQWESRNQPPGQYSGIGKASKLRSSDYTEKDIISIPQSELQFALGLAAAGETLQDYRNLFGESLIVNHHYFGFPAVEQAAVDYAWYSKTHPGLVHFLHGFRFSGDFNVCLRFGSSSPVTLLDIARKSAEICGNEFFGLVMLGKSAGIYGLNLRKIPWQENAPGAGDIMQDSNFANWFDFPVEDTGLNQTILAAGIYSRSGDEEELHMHAVVFSKGLIGKTGMDLNLELQRIVQGAEPLKVVHLLEESRFLFGLAGIIIL
ncbi:MAG: STAS domain-containing protein [Bacteroidetes bacterium]|nr:STAS domain-containing protein [Bacteroidota bacterium]